MWVGAARLPAVTGTGLFCLARRHHLIPEALAHQAPFFRWQLLELLEFAAQAFAFIRRQLQKALYPAADACLLFR